MRVAFYTLGCKVNQYETTVLAQQFAAAGFDVVEPEEDAEVYVVNSCTVTATGDKKSRQMLRRFRRQNPAAVTCLTGCFPQAFPDVAERIPEADIITGSKNRAGLLAAVQSRLAGGGRIIDIASHGKGEQFEQMQVNYADRTRAFLKIQDGCDRYCAYCIIPTARGPVRSKTLAALESELTAASAAGFREVVLLGINLSRYGQDLGLRLLDAVRMACGTLGLSRVRLGSLEPELLTPADSAAMAALPNLCPQFHLSLQSGCDSTLQRMRRHYTTTEYLGIVENLRASFPGCAITTDMMVGFPGETEKEFAQSLAFARMVGFAKVHVFVYSARPGTLAAKLPEQVPHTDKARRAKELTVAVEEDRQGFLCAQVGSRATVMVEGQLSLDCWEGYTENYTPALIYSGDDLYRKLCKVRITGVRDQHCLAELEE